MNFLVTSATVGNVFELIGGPELLNDFWLALQSRSWPELLARRARIQPLWPGEEYANVLLHFATASALAPSSPIVAPAGALYLASKHYVDSVRLRRRHAATAVDRDFHALAAAFVAAAAVLPQCYVAVYLHMRAGKVDSPPSTPALAAGFATAASIALLVAQTDSRWTWPVNLMPPKENAREEE